MKLVYRLLGIAATLSDKGNRERLYFIPMHYLCGFLGFSLCAIGGLVCYAFVWKGLAYLLFALPVFVFAFFAASLLRQHIIFESTGGWRNVGAQDSGLAYAPEDVRYSGRLFLPGKGSCRFLSVPAVMSASPAGTPIFAAQLDASISFLGSILQDRSGLWLSEIKEGTRPRVERGLQYVGLSVRPALRITYVDAQSARQYPITSVISFGAEEDCEQARQLLESREMTRVEALSVPEANPVAIPPQDRLPVYKFSGQCPPSGALRLTAGALVLGILAGCLYHYAALLLDVALVMPALAGLLAGFPFILMAKKVRCRSLRLIVLLGAVAGITVVGSRIMFDSVDARPAMVRTLAGSLSASGMQASQAQSLAESELTPVRTLEAYERSQAWSGVSIKMSDMPATRVSGFGYWLLLGLNTLTAVLGSLICFEAIYRDPYCEKDGQWMQGVSIAHLAMGQTAAVEFAVHTRDWATLAGMTPNMAVDKQRFCEVMLHLCPTCGAGAILVVNSASMKMHNTGHLCLDAEDVQRLEEALADRTLVQSV